MKKASLLIALMCMYSLSFSQFGPTPTIPISQPITWIGSVSSLWSDPQNWLPNQVPGPMNTVLFTAAYRQDCDIDIPATVYSVRMERYEASRLQVTQLAPVTIRFGAELKDCFWNADLNKYPPKGFPLRIESGPYVGISTSLWPHANTYFGGDAYFLENSGFDLHDTVVFKGNVYIGTRQFLDPILPNPSVTIFSGDQNQRLVGTTYWGYNIVVDKPNNTALIIDSINISQIGYQLYAARNVHLKNGRVTGIGGLQIEGDSLTVSDTFDGLETRLQFRGSSLVLDHPLLTAFNSELLLESYSATSITTSKNKLIFGNGNGKIIVSGYIGNGSNMEEIEYRVRELRFNAPNTFAAVKTTLSGNLYITPDPYNTPVEPQNWNLNGTSYSTVTSPAPIIFTHLTIAKENGATVAINAPAIETQKFIGKSGTLQGPGAIWATDSVITYPGTSMQAPLVFKGTNQFAKLNGGWLGHITLNQASSGLVTLLGNLTIGQQSFQRLDLINGVLKVPYPYLLSFGEQAIVQGGSVSSFISGPMRKTGQTAFTFPSGYKLNTQSTGYFAPVRISGDAFFSNLTGPATYQVNYYRSNPQTQFGTSILSPMTGISALEYWQILPIAGARAFIWLSYNNQRSGVPMLATKYQAGFMNSSGAWINQGNRQLIIGGLEYIGAVAAQQNPVYFTIGSSQSGALNLQNTLAQQKPMFESLEHKLELFPNPAAAQQVVIVENKAWRNQQIQIRLLNTNGATVQQNQVQFDINGRARFKLDQLPKGSYYLQANSTNQQAVKLIMIQ